MAKQTFTTGQVLTAAQMTDLQATALGGGAPNTKTADYVLVAADAGTTVAMNAAGATTITVDTGLFSPGDTVFIQNIGAGLCTITAGTATVDTAGSLILPQYNAGILYFTSASAAIFYDYIQVGAASPLTTKGDLYTFSTSDTRLGVGANGTVLTAASGEATGLEWAAPASGSTFAGVQLTASDSGSQTISNNSFTKLTWNVENYDVGDYATGGDTITIPSGKSGYYLVIARGYWDTNTAGMRQIAIYKNGTRIYMNNMTPAGTNNYPTSMVQAVFYAEATDTIEAYVKQTSGGSLAIFKSQTNDEGGCLSAAFLGA